MAPLVRVCVTGPESTGKTTLAMRLAQWSGTLWVPEGSREYAERKAAPLDATDVEPIAQRQIALMADAEARAATTGARLLVLDTDLLSTVVYARHYYGEVPPAVMREARARRADLYLLCDVDVPWVADGVRDRPSDRGAMHALFSDALAQEGIVPVAIRGGWDERWAMAMDAVRRAMPEAG